MLMQDDVSVIKDHHDAKHKVILEIHTECCSLWYYLFR